MTILVTIGLLLSLSAWAAGRPSGSIKSIPWQKPYQEVPPSEGPYQPDQQLIVKAMALVQLGHCDEALEIIERYFGLKDRDTSMDQEAKILREACLQKTPVPEKGKEEKKEPTGKPVGRPKMEAVQIFIFNSSNLNNLPLELASLKARGIDTIIVKAFHNRGDRPLFKKMEVEGPGVYFLTDEAPMVADVIGRIVSESHSLDMRVFAWLNTRKSDWLISQRPDWLEYQYDFDLRRNVPSRSLSIFQGGVREKLTKVACDLARTGVDGILIQDDFIMRYNEGFSSLSRQVFLMEKGKGVHPDDLYVINRRGGHLSGFKELFWEWCRWKNESLMSFLDELIRSLHEVNPALLTAVNVYYESILDPKNGLAWYAQDVRELLEEDVDYIALMSYHRQMKAELSLDDDGLEALLREMIIKSKALAIDEARIIFKIQTIDWDSVSLIPQREVEYLRKFFGDSGHFSTALLQNLMP